MVTTMGRNIEDMELEVRPSQAIRTFAPGAIYDNIQDSMMILGIDYWNPDTFGSLHDPYLLAQIRGNSRYFANLTRFASVSSPADNASIPVATFPTWGMCTDCYMLQRRRGGGTRTGFRCGSADCARTYGGSRRRETVPVRFIVACERGHVDDFPFYEWVHRRQDGRGGCSKHDARLYLEDRESDSPSLESKFVACRNCGRSRHMGMALTRTGVEYATGRRCSGRRPWLKGGARDSCDLPAQGMLRGATNAYFPVTRSALTIPPFSDDLSRDIIRHWEAIEKLSRNLDIYRDVLAALFDTKSDDGTDGRYTLDDVIERCEVHRRARSRNEDSDILALEFDQLKSLSPVDDLEFKTAPADVPDQFPEIRGVTLVERLRQIVTVTGFTRINPPDAESDTHIAPLSSKPPQWLPAAENRGEGIFLSLDHAAVEAWESRPEIQDRMSEISGGRAGRTVLGREVDARYVLLHSLSHMMIRSMADLAGYYTSSLQERIYSSDTMAGLLIFTSSSSSDGSLGGLVEQGKQHRMEQILRRALSRSMSCSSDPLCSFNKPGRQASQNGAACHVCMFLPETSCETMNDFLDRSMVYSTLDGHSRGFFPDGRI